MSNRPPFRMMKVFDCQWSGMPDDVREAFFSFYERGNDIWVDWSLDDDKCTDEESDQKRILVNNWLMANGAEKNETVLIKHWW